jgi:hypothetical protein
LRRGFGARVVLHRVHRTEGEGRSAPPSSERRRGASCGRTLCCSAHCCRSACRCFSREGWASCILCVFQCVSCLRSLAALFTVPSSFRRRFRMLSSREGLKCFSRLPHVVLLARPAVSLRLRHVSCRQGCVSNNFTRFVYNGPRKATHVLSEALLRSVGNEKGDGRSLTALARRPAADPHPPRDEYYLSLPGLAPAVRAGSQTKYF